MKQQIKIGDVAEYTFPDSGETVHGDVVKVRTTSVDVRWHGGRVEKISFKHTNGVTFRSA